MDICSTYRAHKRIDKESLAQATEDELLALKELVDRDNGVIGDQLTAAKAAATSRGVYADSDWYRRINVAKRIKGLLSQHIQNELGRRKRVRREVGRQENDKNLFGSLLTAMRAVLPPEQVESVLVMWRQIRPPLS